VSHPTSSLRKEAGTYALLLQAGDRTSIEVGQLGTLAVQPGCYVYVGSAFGPGGVRARVQRHAQTEKRRHWHVDYVRAATRLEGAWVTYDDRRRECTWAQVLGGPLGGAVSLAGCGASDCDCPAHLFRFAAAPSLARFEAALDEAVPDHAPVIQHDAAALRGAPG
jgi:Uri superfamily endonuclease